MTYLLNHSIALCISFNPGKSHMRYYPFFPLMRMLSFSQVKKHIQIPTAKKFKLQI